jgi:hypothetical protein
MRESVQIHKQFMINSLVDREGFAPENAEADIEYAKDFIGADYYTDEQFIELFGNDGETVKAGFERLSPDQFAPSILNVDDPSLTFFSPGGSSLTELNEIVKATARAASAQEEEPPSPSELRKARVKERYEKAASNSLIVLDDSDLDPESQDQLRTICSALRPLPPS